MDFVFDALANGKPIKCLNVVDDCTKEAVVIEAARRINGQGVADLLFKEGDAWILVDYKSDRGLSPEELASRYRLQLELYARALGGILRQPVKECWLYSFALGKTILLEEAARGN